MRTCGPCGRQYRRGRLVWTLRTDGSLARVHACSTCADRGVTIVTPRAPAPEPLMLDGQELDTRKTLRALARKFRGLAKAYGATVYESCADIVEEWAKNPAARVSS